RAPAGPDDDPGLSPVAPGPLAGRNDLPQERRRRRDRSEDEPVALGRPAAGEVGEGRRRDAPGAGDSPLRGGAAAAGTPAPTRPPSTSPTAVAVSGWTPRRSTRRRGRGFPRRPRRQSRPASS